MINPTPRKPWRPTILDVVITIALVAAIAALVGLYYQAGGCSSTPGGCGQ